VLEGTEQVGFNDVVVDPGGVIRRALLFMDDGATSMYALGLRLALLYLAAEGIVAEPDPVNAEHLRLGRTTIRPLERSDGGYVSADARGYQFLLDFQPGRVPFRSFSARDVLSGAIEADAFRDKLALIGTTAKSVADIFYVPQGLFEAEDGIPGMVVHAHVAGQLLRAALDGVPPMTSPSDLAEETWVLLWGVAGGILALWARSPWRFACCTTIGPVLLAGVAHYAFARHYWVPVVPPALAWGASAAVVTAYLSKQERLQRKLLMQLFSRHVSPSVAETVWRQRDQFLKGGRPRPQRLTATVLFSDLRGFTAVSEKLAPEILVEWLNEYIESMAEQVIAHGGLIDKYIGDAVMAVFGLPLPSMSHPEVRHDAVDAVRCALAMESTIAQLNAGWQRKGLPTMAMRIGIATGPLVAGSLGSAERLQYTVIGDTVNTAARLASYDQDAASPGVPPRICNILVIEETACYIRDRFEVVRIGNAALKGKAQRVTIYRVVGSLPSQTDSKAEGEP
jgi:adenylate cyclase